MPFGPPVSTTDTFKMVSVPVVSRSTECRITNWIKHKSHTLIIYEKHESLAMIIYEKHKSHTMIIDHVSSKPIPVPDIRKNLSS